MKYAIGEFAKLLGVTTDTIRLYEKEGIITPEKDEKNNYRYFDDLDARDLLTSRWYRSMDFALKETAQLIHTSEIDTVKAKLRDKRHDLEAEIDHKTKLLAQITRYEEDLSTISDGKITVTIIDKPTLYRVKQTDHNLLIKNENFNRTVSQMMDALPFSFYSVRIGESALQNLEDTLPFDWGLAILEEHFDQTGLKNTHHFDTITLGTCLSTTLKVANGGAFSPALLRPLIETLEKLNLQINGDLIGRLIFREKTSTTHNAYITFYLPVKPKGKNID